MVLAGAGFPRPGDLGLTARRQARHGSQYPERPSMMIRLPSRAHKLPARSRLSIRKSTLSHHLTTDHLSRGRRTCARFAACTPNSTLIQVYFQEKDGTFSSPPSFLDISAASSKMSSLAG